MSRQEKNAAFHPNKMKAPTEVIGVDHFLHGFGPCRISVDQSYPHFFFDQADTLQAAGIMSFLDPFSLDPCVFCR